MVTGHRPTACAHLVDARNGVVDKQRDTFIADLLGIKRVAVCINKMDLVGYDEESTAGSTRIQGLCLAAEA